MVCHGRRARRAVRSGPRCRSCASSSTKSSCVGLAERRRGARSWSTIGRGRGRPPARGGPRSDRFGTISPLDGPPRSRALLAKTQGGDETRCSGSGGQRAARRRALPADPRPHRGPAWSGPSPIRGSCCAGSPRRSSVTCWPRPCGIPTGRPRRAGPVQPARRGADARRPARARRPRAPSGRARGHAPADPARHQGGRDRGAARGRRLLQLRPRPRRADRGALPPAVARPDARASSSRRWDPRAAEQLVAAVDELPQRSRVFLLSRLRAAFRRRRRPSPARRRRVDREGRADGRGRCSPAVGRPEALDLLRERRRPDGGPILPLVEIEALGGASSQLDEAIALAGREAEVAAAALDATGRHRPHACSSAGWPSVRAVRRTSLAVLDRATRGHPASTASTGSGSWWPGSVSSRRNAIGTRSASRGSTRRRDLGRDRVDASARGVPGTAARPRGGGRGRGRRRPRHRAALGRVRRAQERRRARRARRAGRLARADRPGRRPAPARPGPAGPRRVATGRQPEPVRLRSRCRRGPLGVPEGHREPARRGAQRLPQRGRRRIPRVSTSPTSCAGTDRPSASSVRRVRRPA